MDLRGMKLVVDCAHGATYHIAPAVFEELGAHIVPLGNKPDGFNINDRSGATSPETLQQAVIAAKADAGIALDGDGDRLIMVDHAGEVIDGDEITFIIARHRQQLGRLQGAVVGTQMSNLGLELALKTLGVELKRAKVGDRYIMEMLTANGWTLGGESSGHIICLDLTSTGDGIISALQVLEAMLRTGQTLATLKAGMMKFPQTLLNVRLKERMDVTSLPKVRAGVAEVEQKLGSRGRVLLRPSGTEPVIRVMVEGQDAGQVDELSRFLADVVAEAVDQSIAAGKAA
jgi:phosphoglucosamine mutase